MNVFISQPMKGKSVEQIVSERNTVIDLIESRGDVALSSIIVDGYPTSVEQRVWYLGKEIMILSQADAVYFMNGWEDSNGCKVEHKVAEEYGIKILSD